MDVPYDLLINWLEQNGEFKRYVEDKYRTEYEYYRRFKEKNGRRCPIARSALKRMVQLALQSKDSENLLIKLLKNEL